MIRTENISESEEQRMNKKIFKRAVAMMMAAVLTVGAALPRSNVFASGSDEEKDTKTLAVYDADARADLDEDEVVTAGDIVIAAGYGFDIENDMEGIVYEQEKVTVSYYPDQGSFDADKQGDYDTYYKVEPVSGKDAYLVHRTIAVKEITTEQTDNTEAAPTEDTKETADDEEPVPGSEDTEYIDLDTQIVKGLSIQRAPAAMLKAAPASGMKDGKDSMKVGFSGYAKFCGRSMGVKYISESGDYYHHSVYCLDLNKKTTNGTVSKSSSTKKVKPEITYCLVNGVRELNKTCHNSKYSSGHATEDYFITGAAIHVLNGEVKLSYYGKGNTGTYAKISALVTDAKKYSTDDYNDNGLTKSISYSISPAKSKWEKVADGLYRSKEKFVRTKKGTIKNIKYTISGAPAGLTTGEIKTDASKIDDENDLKKYDICVAQTDASKASSNFYLYCNQTAMDKITKNDSTIKVRAKAYSDEKGGSKWTPTVVSQQKITFLEEFIDQKSDEATVKVTSNYKLGSFQLHKTDSYKGTPVVGAKYYLYEDSACTDLLCNDYRDKCIKNQNGKLYGKIVRAYHIYTRVVDNNTAIDKQADINDIEFLWRKRFGIDLSIMERLNRLLDDTDKWVFDWGNKKYCYHIDSPEFQIVQMEDMQQGWVPAAAFYAHPVMYFARLNVMYHNTTIYESVLWSFDEFRKYLPEARNSGVKNKMDFWYSYYLLDSIEGKMLKIFTHRSCDISSREPNYHQILIFENEDQKKEFDMYVFEHFDDHSDEEINDKYKYQIQEDKKENLGGLKFSAYQVAKIAWLYEDWRS